MTILPGHTITFEAKSSKQFLISCPRSSMASSRSCDNCGKTCLVRDDVSGDLICSSCGVVQEYDQFEAHIGGINGPQGTYIRVGTAGIGTVYSYKERKLFGAQSLIDELTSRLGLSSKSSDIRAMISTITEGEFGLGDWFQVLIGACAYIVMRKDNRPLSMAEVAWAVGCDVYELGKMIQRVIDFMDLKKHDFPEFDIVHSLERALKNSPSFTRIEGSTVDRMRKQGIFLIQCAVKWFLSTGRRPLPLVVAVLVLVAELNQVEVRIDELAQEVHATVSTSRRRYKELLETLVEVAQVLPWGKDITIKNIVKNASLVIQYMEKKAMSKPIDKREKLDHPKFNLAEAVSECLQEDDGYEYRTEEANKLHISPECLSVLHKKSLNKPDGTKVLKGREETHRREKLQIDDLHECSEWWNGQTELSKKLLLKQVLEIDVGLETMPPSFMSGCLKNNMRREKINAAKARINRIMHPLNADQSGSANLSPLGETCYGKKRKRKGTLVDGVDWEDLIIETLLLHHVKEEEIEKGHYNTLLDLYVFNSGIL